MRIGIVSDTHGLVRPEVLAQLQGVSCILHAGDVGRRSVLEALTEIAPVHAVRGNVDRGAWAEGLPETAWVEVGGRIFYVLHDLDALDLDPEVAGIDVVVSGHSHKPSLTTKRGVTYLNPGSIGPRRFKLPIAMAHGDIGPTGVAVELTILQRFD
ncbi:MAG: metallophosphoesterase family protein [Myxococcota bacterium]